MNHAPATHADRTPRSDKTGSLAAPFDTTHGAADAKNDLLDNGYPGNAVSLVANNAAGEGNACVDQAGNVVAANDGVAAVAAGGAYPLGVIAALVAR